MTIRNPADENRVRGGADVWDDGPAGQLLTLEFFGGPVDVTIVGTGFASANAFGAGTVSNAGGAQTITQTAGFVDADAFGAGALVLRLAGTGFSDPDAFGTGGVSTRLTGTGFTDPDAFGSGSLALRLAGLGFLDPDAFGAGTVAALPPAQTITQTAGFADPDAFGAAAIRLWLQQIAGLDSSNAFGQGALTVTGGLVRGPLRRSPLRPQNDETRPGEATATRAMDAPSARTSTDMKRPADAARVRDKA
jgi:hypothetical protein